MAKAILTVDDASMIRKVVGLALAGASHQVIDAEEGVAAPDVLRSLHFDRGITVWRCCCQGEAKRPTPPRA